MRRRKQPLEECKVKEETTASDSPLAEINYPLAQATLSWFKFNKNSIETFPGSSISGCHLLSDLENPS